jgi:osmotically-inducible protein OsmY
MAAEQPAERVVSEADMELEELVTEAIRRDTVIRETHVPIDVSVTDGVVTVGGVVLSRIMHDRVLFLAASVRGVKKVIDALFSDPEIAVAIAARIAEHKSFNNDQIDIASYHGRVMVAGEVDTEEERVEVVALAAAVPGVRQVIDRLEIKGGG